MQNDRIFFGAIMMRLFKVFIVLFFSLLIPIHSYAVSNDKINDLARNFMKENQVEGMSVAVLDKNRILILNYGIADEFKKTPVTNDTIYTIASFSKTVTATLAAIASVENKLNLDEPFIQHFPGLNNDKDMGSITTRELLGHVSSLPFDFTPRPKTYPELVSALNHFDPKWPPGTEYSYSNASIGVVGYVLQNVYSEKYQDILNGKILKPLHMTSTFLTVPAEKEKYIALGHEKDNKIVPYSKDNGVWFAAASLKSTISDMAKYLNAHINYASLQDKNLARGIAVVHENNYCFADKLSCEQLAWQAHVISELKNSSGDSYFVAYDSNDMPTFARKQIMENGGLDKSKIFIDKTGSGFGMSSYMAYIPADKVGVVILLNKGIADERIKLGRDILRSLGSA
uniref:Pip4 n=1 Tax=uncultured bacterium AOPip4 TaxID=654982 RepID=D6MLY8_9BACT|nr:Pip4 [uncultured bacterium AOPip4]